MMQKTWFKVFIWVISSAFFFLASVMVIAFFNPASTNEQAMLYMSGMMKSMESSMMGLSMALESNSTIKPLIIRASIITIPLSIIAAIFAIIVRLWGSDSSA